ncbi:hypothetical protein IHV25_08795 [Phaeovibrio sulfidiphilus]|uniref:Uncharacterized protein n=1 Tax=Phaeovibrio sulfidiphilus TaxID=1220600 RepID=A0A8J7CDH4_9PROT|nr:hypothetical protein [Phaeovibrio sulfidiphilus]MBE1237743.1 hypothetical protein [Phaeovibrio sulfidiphilus]
MPGSHCPPETSGVAGVPALTGPRADTLRLGAPRFPRPIPMPDSTPSRDPIPMRDVYGVTTTIPLPDHSASRFR